MPYAREESNFENDVIEAVIDTNYRRLIEGRSIDISLGGIHNKDEKPAGIPFIYDNEPGLDDFPSDIAQSQRCAWHSPRGIYHSLWEDGLKKKDSQPHTDKLKHLIGIKRPQGDYELLKDEDKQAVEKMSIEPG